MLSDRDMQISIHHQPEIETMVLSSPYAVGGSGSIVSVSTAPDFLVTSTELYSWPFSEPSPSCSPRYWTDCKTSADCKKCTVSGGTVQLLYFPVSRTASTGNLTAAPATKTSNLPETAVFDNTTLTSGSVYISFNTAYAKDACGTQVGGRYPGAILAMDPKSLSTVNMIWGTMYSTNNLDPFHSSPYLIASSFNLADLNFPVPASAYMAQPKCQNGPFQKCTIVLDDYNPLLEVPPQIRNLDPAWKDCELDWQGLYDPPKALHPAEVEAQATMPASDPVATAAEPQSSMILPAKQTSSPAAGHFTTAASADAQATDSIPPDVNAPSTPSLHQSSQGAAGAPVPSARSSSVANQVIPNAPLAPEVSRTASSRTIPGGSSNTPADIPESSMPSDATMPLANSGASDAEHQSASTEDLADDSQSLNPTAPSQLDSDIGSAGAEPTAAGTTAQQDPSVGNRPQNPSSSEGAEFSALVGAVEQSGTVSATVESEGSSGSTDDEAGASLSSINPTQQDIAAEEQTSRAPSRPDQTKTHSEANAAPKARTSSTERVASIAGEVLTYGGDAKTIYGQLMTMKSDGVYWSDLPTESTQAAPTSGFGLPTMEMPSGTSSAVGEGASPAPTLAPSVPRLVFTFGEHTYTAIQTAGPNEAVIGKTTVSVGHAASLPGGMVSLNSEGLAMTPDSEDSPEATKTVSGRIGVVTQTEGNPTLELLQTSGNLVLNDMATFSSSNSLWRLSGMTLSAVPQGFVQIGGKNHTFSMSKTVLTQVGTSILDGKESTTSTAAMTTYSTLTYSELPGVTTATTATTASNGAVERALSNCLVVITVAIWFTVLFEV